MKALIHNNTVVDIAETSFEVHTDMFWIDVDSNVKVGWKYINDVLIEPEQSKLTYKELRAFEYPNLTDQLDMLYWDKINGTNNWETAIQAVKDKYPKG